MKSSFIRRASFFLLCLVCSIPAYAAIDLGYLKSLVDKRDFKTAYSYAIKHLEENEGDPEFDYLFGMAAIDTGEISKGIFSLERVLIVQPGNHVARLELARAYFLLGEDLRARQEFETILKKNPPAGVRASINQFLNAIKLRETRYKTSSKAYAEMSFGYDNNVNGGPATADFTSPLFGALSLNDSSISTDDAFYKASVGGAVNAPVAPGEYFTMGYDVSYRGHKDTEAKAFNTKTFNGYASGSILDGKSKYKFGGQINLFYLDNDRSRNIMGLNGEWQYTLDNSTQLTVSGQINKYHYPGSLDLNTTSVTTGFGLSKRFDNSLKPIVFANLIIGRDFANESGRAPAAVADRTVYGFRTGAQLMLTPKFSFSGALLAQKIGYGEENSFFGKRRKDDFWSASLSSNWLFMENWSLRADVSFIENDSNIKINNYDRIEGQLSVRHDFQ
ncbi:MAG: hypothetical protein OEW89_08995 [Gammaproteobacteria bacterium]|nr:hypothetical protein [Gammaproteobacteria bacterium]